MIIAEEKKVLALNPIDWLDQCRTKKKTIKNLFEMRNNFNNINLNYLNVLLSLINLYLKENPYDDEIIINKVKVILQSAPTIENYFTALKCLRKITNTEVEDYVPLKQYIIKTIKEYSGKRTLKRLNISVSDKCPYVCKGCYNIFHNEQMSFDSYKNIINQSRDCGVEEIILSGGDPFLWEYIMPYVKYLNEEGMKVGIDTTGYTLDDTIINKVAPFLNYLGIPFDGESEETIKKFRRGKNNIYNKTLDIIKSIDKINLNIRINTLLHKGNFNCLSEIYNRIYKFQNVKTWSIYQWWDLRANADLRNDMYLNTKDFRDVTKEIIHLNSTAINIEPRTILDREHNTLFISTNGDCYTFGDSKMTPVIILGNIFNNNLSQLIASPAITEKSNKFYNAKRFQND